MSSGRKQGEALRHEHGIVMGLKHDDADLDSDQRRQSWGFHCRQLLLWRGFILLKLHSSCAEPNNPRMQFEDDVYIATSEPHGDIEAVVTRAQLQPHAKL